MFQIFSKIGLLIQAGILLVLFIGLFNLWKNTKDVESQVRNTILSFGIGMMFICAATLERVLVNFAVLVPNDILGQTQDIINLIGLIFLSIGFSKTMRYYKK